MAKKLLDIEKVIGDKNPVLLKRMPRFVLNYLKKILHEEEINKVIDENAELLGEAFAAEVIERYKISLKVENLEKIPSEGGVIIASNHPIGGFEALAMVIVFSKVRPDIKFLVNDILLHLENLKGLFVGVNKHGSNAAVSLQQINDLFNSDKAVFIFPAGLVSRRIKGKIEDLEWKKTFVTRARKYKKPIIPLYIDGRLSNFFYRFANFRKSMGIKANLEMLYLVNEQFKLKEGNIGMIVGDIIQPEEMDDSRTDKEWTAEIRKRVYQLKKPTK